MYRCSTCDLLWDDDRARGNDLTCVRRCGGQLVPVAPLALPDLETCDLGRLPYPVALTADRLAAALRASSDVLKTLFLLKDCFEAAVKYLATVLLADYRRGPACTPERNQALLEKMVKPSLGAWVNDVVRPLSLWLAAGQEPPGSANACNGRWGPTSSNLFRAWPVLTWEEPFLRAPFHVASGDQDS